MSIEELRENLEYNLQNISENLEAFTNASKRLGENINKLEDISKVIIEYLENGKLAEDMTEQKLWHDLNNLNHNLSNYTAHIGESILGDLKEAVIDLIDPLSAARPKKSN